MTRNPVTNKSRPLATSLALAAAGCVLLASVVPRNAAAQTAFVHPGVLHTSADLDRMKAMVAARAEPYTMGWTKLQADARAKLTYAPRPFATVQRIPDTVSYQALNSDAIAAHLNAIEWTVTGDAAHARKSVEILNAWSSTLTTFPSTGDPVLTAGLTGYQLAAAAEIIRATYPQWAAADQQTMKTLLLTRFYPIFHNFLIFHEPDGLPRTNTGVNLHFFASWDAIAMASMAAIAVFADDRAKYQEALDSFKNGTGNGAIMRAVFDGETGQLQESGRDPEHAQLGIGLLATLCEIAWNQGDDLYGYADNRLLKGFEYTASYLLGNTVPFRIYADPFRTFTVISTEFSADQIASARNNPRPIYEMVWNHYVNRRGIAAPFTKQVAEKIRPEGYRADHIGFGTLLFTRPAGSGTTTDGGIADAGAATDGGATTEGGMGSDASGGGRDAGTGGAVGTGGSGGGASPTGTGGSGGGASPTGTGGAAAPTGTGGAAAPTGTGGAAAPTGTGGAAPAGTGGTAGNTGIGPGITPTNVASGCACRIAGREISDDYGGQVALVTLLAFGAVVSVRRCRRRKR